MLLEYAVDPRAIGANWETFRYVIEKFGFDQGRLIAWFPGSWDRDVIVAARASNMGTIKLQSVTERLARSKRNARLQRGRRYDPVIGDWLANAIS
jgi:hypothetical protein